MIKSYEPGIFYVPDRFHGMEGEFMFILLNEYVFK